MSPADDRSTATARQAGSSHRRTGPLSAQATVVVVAALIAGSTLSGCAAPGPSIAPSPALTTDGASPSAPASPAPPASAAPRVPSVAFVADPLTPVVTRSQTGVDELYINPGAVIDADGSFHMYANLFTAWPGRVQMPHLTSTDGIAWELVPGGPILTSVDVPFAKPGADVSSGYVDRDGTWVLVFQTVSGIEPWSIGRATAPGPAGPWAVDPEPMLVAGPVGAMDAGGLHWPTVVVTDAGYAMYYQARATVQGTGAIAMATSPDGRTWTKREMPVLEATLPWERGSLDRPRVVATPAGFAMVYSGGRVSDRGLAWSDDGVEWRRDGEAPVITVDDLPIDGSAWDAALILVADHLIYFLEAGVTSAPAGTQVYRFRATLP